MKHLYLAFVALLFPFGGFSQESWFVAEAGCLQLRAPAEAATSVVSWPSEIVEDAFWSLRFQLNFVPSSSNYFRWHLSADSSDLQAKSEGFALQVGKQLVLEQNRAGKRQKLLASPDVILVAGEYGLEVAYEAGRWQFRCYDSGDSLLYEGEAEAQACAESHYSGFECVYTKTRSEGFRFCEIESLGSPYLPPWQPDSADVLLNELLPYPLAGGCDYVELYNAGDSVVRLSDLKISNGKTVCELPPHEFPPQTYVLLSTCPEQIAANYPYADPQAFVGVPKLPAFASDSGSVWLLRSDGLPLDVLHYSPAMHNSRLDTRRGVALERIPGTSQWTSASAAFHYGSPGLANPIATYNEDEAPWGVSLLSRHVSPDGDGQDDRLGVVLHFDQPVQVRLTVCSLYGNTLAVLLDGAFCGRQCYWWEVTDTNGRAIAPGICLLVCEILGDGGLRQFKKIPFVVAD